MPPYGDASYWDQRYQREPSCFDWYQTYAGLEPILKRHLHPQDQILHIGAGTSQLQVDMVQQGGYQQIVNTDISAVVIKQMQELHKSIPQLTYRVGDARSMPEFQGASFDSIVDKGTLDAILCGQQARENATGMLSECYRVLRPGGVLFIITYGEPTSRMPFLQQQGLDWDVSLYVLGKQDGAGLTPAAAMSPIIQGPLDAKSLASYDVFSDVSGAHYVYVCAKNGNS
eukprot:GHRR01017795.1.p1 GENE.GHRR01017795.1~~GHRR01017795.1.p1  ORF type:complete len:228 (+),score=50.43 GHRR01017795.1:1093-1776(+)